MTVKERAERFFSDTPVKPVHREMIEDVEVFVADGYVTPDMYLGLQIKFAVPLSKAEHPQGCYATIWFAENKTGAFGGAGYFDNLHDIEHVSIADRQRSRINAVLSLARSDIKKRKKMN